MVISTKIKSAIVVFAVALSFLLYALSFEPYGMAELAYVFAVPAIIVCKILFAENKDYKKILFRAKTAKNQKSKNFYAQILQKYAPVKKTYLITSFICGYLAWIWLLIWLRHVWPPSGWGAVAVLPLIISTLFIFPWFAALTKFLPSSEEDALTRLIKYAGLAGLWVLLEWIRSWIFTGFPWLLIANSQWTRIAVIQSASWGGVWIVSFSLIFFNLAISEYLYKLYAMQKAKFLKGEHNISKLTPEFYVALLLVLSGVWTYIANLPRAENQQYEFRAGVVQPDFAGILKWEDSIATENLRVINALTKALAKTEVNIILWPEAATPPRFPINFPFMKNWVESLSREIKIPLLIGNMSYDMQTQSAQNGAFFVSETDGVSKEYYAKKHLVPFGEYVPKIFSFIGKVVPVGNMKRGENDYPIDVKIKGKTYKTGVMICYEDVFPALARTMARNGSDMLFVCTNDSWYGREAGAWQHASHSALQAVATRKILMRSSNNGLSTVFDQYGRMFPCTTITNSNAKAWHAKGDYLLPISVKDEFGNPLDTSTLKPKRPAPMLDENGSIYFRGCGFIDVISYKNFANTKTFYVHYGDWVVALSALFVILALVKSAFEKKSLK